MKTSLRQKVARRLQERNTAGRQRFTMSLPPALHKKAKAEAARTGVTLNKWVTALVDIALNGSESEDERQLSLLDEDSDG